MKSRYCYSPQVYRKPRRMTILDRMRRNRAVRRQARPDVYPICGYNAPVFPGK